MTTAVTWLRPLPDTATGIPTRREVRGSRCGTLQGLFTEWAAALRFPDHFGHNWDAFADCLRDTLTNASLPTAGPDAPRLTLVLREADGLLVDEPDTTLAVLLSILDDTAGADSGAPRLLLLLDGTPDGLSRLAGRMTDAGYEPDTA
ncbi:barstar family protein [Streptomyces sp. NPDC004539]|uniref:barstar family protein n=1 Tax=Streptomyces sp. NPDC004539 TaxID=3154280 RepID=UPI00339F0E4F